MTALSDAQPAILGDGGESYAQTSSLPWNHQEPLCGTPFPQVASDRRRQSYRFSFGEHMCSLKPYADCRWSKPSSPTENPSSAHLLIEYIPLALAGCR
jgi:hypothetical protein